MMIKRICLWLGIILFVVEITFSSTILLANENGPITSKINVCIDVNDANTTCFKSDAIYFGAFQPASMHVGGGGGAGRVAIDDISLIRNPDIFSPTLFLYCANGNHFDQAVIDIIGINDIEKLIMEITLTKVLVSSYRIDTSSNETPREEISLNFAKVCLLVDETEVCWNIEQNKFEPQNP